MRERVEAFLRECVERGDIPGACYAVSGPDGIVAEGAVGRAVVTPESVEAGTGTIYDLASLTKPLITSFLYLALRRRLGLSPDERVARFLPEIDRMDKREITLRHLLTHTSGMPAWVPFYLRGGDMGEYLAQMREIVPEARAGAKVIYSCAGYLMLGEILSRCATEPLDRLATTVILGPLGLRDTAFNPPAAWWPRVAATEDSCQHERVMARPGSDGYSGFRMGVIRGQVHDQNAWVLGGVAGNAGLFSTARETLAIAREYLGGDVEGCRGLLDTEAIGRAREDQTGGMEEARSWAFRIALRGETAAGPDLPPQTFGHNGFTGTSVWIDPVGRRVYVLLTNRVHPRVLETSDMVGLRARFHSLARDLR